MKIIILNGNLLSFVFFFLFCDKKEFVLFIYLLKEKRFITVQLNIHKVFVVIVRGNKQSNNIQRDLSSCIVDYSRDV